MLTGSEISPILAVPRRVPEATERTAGRAGLETGPLVSECGRWAPADAPERKEEAGARVRDPMFLRRNMPELAL